MSSQLSVRLFAAAATAMVCASSHADIFTWNYDASTPQPGLTAIHNNGGSLHSIAARFDTQSRRLDWTVNFSDRVTEGFWLALNDGADPTGRVGEVSAFYFDAYDVFDSDASTLVRLSAYGYSGAASHHSWLDGNSLAAGIQGADCIKSSNDGAWIHSLVASDTVLPGGIAGRTLSFSIDAGDVMSHVPMYSGSAPWKGTGFGQLLGFRMGAASVYEASYNDAGEILELGTESQSFFIGQLLPAQEIPAPTAAALMLAALGLGGRAHRSRGASTSSRSPHSRILTRELLHSRH